MPRFPMGTCSRLAIGVALLSTAWIAAGAFGSDSRLLDAAEKFAILGAGSGGDINNECGYIVQMPCASFNSTGNFTGCANAHYPTCSGDCANSCGQQAQSAWRCPGGADPPYKCPSFPALGQDCGSVTTGASCIGSGGNCYCTGGTPVDPPKRCGDANTQPTPPYQTCPAQP
jgi:hypothetical protein